MAEEEKKKDKRKGEEAGGYSRLLFEDPRLTKDALLLSLSEVINNPLQIVCIGRDKKRTEISINELNIDNKLVLQTFLYALVYYSCMGYREIRLTELMERTGFKKMRWRDESHGFSQEDKQLAFNTVKLLKDLELRTKPFGRNVPYFVSRIFPQAEPKDIIRINPFGIALTVLSDVSGKIKDANIKFTPNFDVQKIYFFSSEEPKVLTFPNEKPELKLLSIFLLRRKAFANQKRDDDNYVIVKVENLLKICGMEMNAYNPKRTKEKLENILYTAREKDILKSYKSLLDGQAYTDVCEYNWGWARKWLESELRIHF
jgi:hypothetical protein